jgi:hypothetical protein
MTELVTERLEAKAAAGAAARDTEGLLGELMGAFEEFKRTNDGRHEASPSTRRQST